jgi:hypothetical protein
MEHGLVTSFQLEFIWPATYNDEEQTTCLFSDSIFFACSRINTHVMHWNCDHSHLYLRKLHLLVGSILSSQSYNMFLMKYHTALWNIQNNYMLYLYTWHCVFMLVNSYFTPRLTELMYTFAGKKFSLLNILMQLRKCCNHPVASASISVYELNYISLTWNIPLSCCKHTEFGVPI